MKNIENNHQQSSVPQAPVCLNLKELPTAVKERLSERQRDAGEGFAFKTAGVTFSYVLLAAATCWFVLLFYLSNDFRWSNLRTGFFAFVTVFASYLFVHHLYKIFRWFTSAQKCSLLITPLYVIEINFNEIRYWDLEQLNKASVVTKQPNGENSGSEIKLSFENGSKTIPVESRQTAEDIIDQINYLRKLYIEANVRNDSHYLDSNDDFRELENRETSTNSARGNFPRQVLTMAASVMLAAGIVFLAVQLNIEFDDRKSWALAQTANRASAYRNYIQTHPQGHWQTEAQAKLKTLYDEAEEKYKAALNKDYDPQAVDAVLQVLRYAKQTQNYRVRVNFERRNEIPPDIVAQLKKEHEVKNIVELDDSFSDEKMQARENDLLAVIADAFKQVIPDDILEISGDCPAECVTFLVKYKIYSDSIYYDTLQEDVPPADRVYEPGIFFTWDFGVRLPDRPQIYNFTLESNPAMRIYIDPDPNTDYSQGDFTENLKADLAKVYNSMVKSAFENFKTNLTLKTGIGVPTVAAEETSEPLKARPLSEMEKSKIKK